jgi:DNA-binding MurR/RpiR family transcriptional regulator
MPGTLPPVLQELLGLYPSLPPAERRIADVIFADPRAVVGLTTSELAKRAAASQPGASQLGRRLSTKTFIAFKIRLAQELGPEGGSGAAGGAADGLASAGPTADRPSGGKVLSQIVDRTHDDLAVALRAVATLDEGALNLAARTIAAAGSIVLCGLNLSGSVAWRLASLLHRSGFRARAESEPHHAPWAADVGPGDVLLIISYRGNVPQLQGAVRRARERGATVMVFTNEAKSPIAAEADVLLLTHAPAATSDDEYTSGPALYVQLAAARALWLATVAVRERGQ